MNENTNQFNAIFQKALKIKASDSSAANKTSNKELNHILEEIALDRKTNKEEAFAALGLLAQMGATSSRTQGRVQVTINNTPYYVELIKKIIKKVTGKSFRRIAKTFATEFKNIAENNGYKGNLYHKIRLHYPDFEISEQDKYWISDFQSENENCPFRIREILNRYYNDYISVTTKRK